MLLFSIVVLLVFVDVLLSFPSIGVVLFVFDFFCLCFIVLRGYELLRIAY